MALLTTTELQEARDDLEATLPDTCTITYVTRTRDGMGGWAETDATRASSVACRISPAGIGGQSGIVADTILEGGVWSLTLAYDQTIQLDDKVTVNGQTFQVSNVSTGKTEILCKRVEVVRWAGE